MSDHEDGLEEAQYVSLDDNDEDDSNAILEALEDEAAKDALHVSASMRRHALRLGLRALRAARRGLMGNRGHCELLLGPKGGGTSSFLKTVSKALRRLRLCDEPEDGADNIADNGHGGGATAAPGRRVMTACIDLGLAMSSSPLDVLAEAAGIAPLPEKYRFDGVAAVRKAENDRLEAGLQFIAQALHAAGSALVLLLDEFHTVYTSTAAHNHLWRSAMYLLPNTLYVENRMRMFAVLSGGSAWLRRLAFGKAPLGQEHFPLDEASRLNLNSQRYHVYQFACLAGMDELRTFLRSHGTPGAHRSNDDVDDVFFASGGNMGLVTLYRQTGDPLQLYSHMAERFATCEKVLRQLHAARERVQQERGGAPASQWPAFTPVASMAGVADSELYAAADHGAILFDDEAGSVCFMTPALAAYAAGEANKNPARLSLPPSQIGARFDGALRLPRADRCDRAANGDS